MKSLRVAVTATHLPIQGRLFSAKRWTKSSSLSKQIYIYKKKKHKGKILVLFLAQKERLELSRRLPDLRP